MSNYTLRVGYSDGVWVWEILTSGKPGFIRPHGFALTERAARRRGERRLRAVRRREAAGNRAEEKWSRIEWRGEE